jgi:hypothetical protein
MAYGEPGTAATEDDQPYLNVDDKGYIYHLNDDTAVEVQDNISVPEDMSVHSNPFGIPAIHFIDDDCYYDPTIDDLLIVNIGNIKSDDASVSSFTSAIYGPSTHKDDIGILAFEGMGMQEIDDTLEKVQPDPLILPAGQANRS